MTISREVAKMRPVIITRRWNRPRAAALLSGCFLAACGSNKGDGGGTSGGDGAAARCGTVDAPTVLTSTDFTDLEPAMGAQVSNLSIVHRFKLVGLEVAFDPVFQPAEAHTAGNPVLTDPDGGPTRTWRWTLTQTGSSVQYEAAPMVWSRAPAHVEFDFPSPQQTAEGCTFSLPHPLFSYDVVPGDDAGDAGEGGAVEGGAVEGGANEGGAEAAVEEGGAAEGGASDDTGAPDAEAVDAAAE